MPLDWRQLGSGIRSPKLKVLTSMREATTGAALLDGRMPASPAPLSRLASHTAGSSFPEQRRRGCRATNCPTCFFHFCGAVQADEPTFAVFQPRNREIWDPARLPHHCGRKAPNCERLPTRVGRVATDGFESLGTDCGHVTRARTLEPNVYRCMYKVLVCVCVCENTDMQTYVRVCMSVFMYL